VSIYYICKTELTGEGTVPNKHYIGIILLALIFTLSLPQITHATSLYDLQDKVRDHSSNAAAYAKKRQWGMCEKESDQVIKYFHKMKRKCRGIFKTCRIRNKEGMRKGFAAAYVMRGYCRAAQKDYSGARNDANTSIRWNNNSYAGYMVLTIVAYSENNIPEARKHHAMVLKLNPKTGASMLKTMPKLNRQ
jgi:tetratricopeptide (TPR) repeat protein